VRDARIETIQRLGLLEKEASFASGPTQEEWNTLTAEQQYFEARRMQAYAGMATAMDYEIGRFVAYLRAHGEYDNTVFMLLSDNGAVANEPYDNPFGRRWLEKHYTREVETLGEKGSWVAAGSHWGLVSNTPLEGYKFYAGEGGVRVPLIIAGLPSIEPGAVNGEFVYITDLAPTLLEIAGLEIPGPVRELEPITGKSLLALLEEGAGSLYGPDEAIGYEFSGNSALYRGDYKLVRNRPPVGDRTWRLYNISADPGETTDLSARMPDLYQTMQEQYAAYVQDAGVLPLPDDYSLVRQVTINSIIFVFLPRYWPYLAGFVIVVVALFLYRARRRAARS
jgi:arylsulfatase A-like enzyme